ncbi:helix-turn-helix domain containing protein [Staphylococcus epidermidis]|uniref:helix-turn-helix domain containing protein n=1 Tax=Staphylococcus epidermidis TaxID=1282 RepID=UPI0028870D0C|nr:helix-turn-helix domain containing protein [Staphylococcus epidermidis]MDT0714508.1 helix-turn-helix domain containing protein [Staphylococcus epidermidis]
MSKNLADFTEEGRKKAIERYHVLEPYLKNLKSIRAVSKSVKIPKCTLYNWINGYKNDGLASLIDKTRKDKHRIKIDEDIINFVQNEYFSNRGISIASIHRKTQQWWCNNKRLPEPSYYQVYNIIKRIPENLKAYSNMNSKKYAEKYDGICTRKCEQPNEIWQADYTMLDIEVLNEKKEIQGP